MLHELITNHSWFMYVAVGLFSLAIGSLLNVVIYRVPLMMQREWKQDCCELLEIECKAEPELNLFYPRSFCPSCKTMVRAWQNIPLLSYLFLKGRCAHCQAPIPMRYPFIEFLTLILSLFACWHFGFTVHLIFALIAIYLLIAMFYIDLDHQLLPDSMTLGLLWVGLIANTMGLFASLPDAVLSAVGGYLSLWLFTQAHYLLSGKIGMGHGDFKLFAAFGAWFGWKLLPLIILFAAISGTLVGLAYLYLSKKSKDTTIAFGPYLCIAGLVSLFWGKEIVDWYLTLWF